MGTKYIRSQLKNTETINNEEKRNNLISEIHNTGSKPLNIQLQEYLTPLLEPDSNGEKKYTFKTKLEKFCNRNRKTIRGWLKDGKIRRESLLCLAVIFSHNKEVYDGGFNVDIFNNTLCKRAGFTQLYARFPSDIVWIYMIDNDCWDGEQNIEELHNELLEKYYTLERSILPTQPQNSTGKTKYVRRIIVDNTYPSFDVKMKAIIDSHYDFNGFEKLIETLNKLSVSKTRIDEIVKTLKKSINSQTGTRNVPALNEIRKNLITLGLYKRLSVNAIDELLGEAHLNVLYSMNPVEAVIIFTLEQLQKENPNLFVDCVVNQTDLDTKDAPMDIVIKNLESIPKALEFQKNYKEEGITYIKLLKKHYDLDRQEAKKFIENLINQELNNDN